MGHPMGTTMRIVAAVNTALYRTTRGRVGGRLRGMPVLLLTVKGRKSGLDRTNPVWYLEHDGGYVVAGSAHGSPMEPIWFSNLRAGKTASIQLGATSHEVDITIADAALHAVLWERLIARAPVFVQYQAKTERQIPLALLTPR